MTDELSVEKGKIIEQAQDIADEYLSGDNRTTEVTLWDDGDFKVEVKHGFNKFREKIVWRSSESSYYPEAEFVRVVDTVDVAQHGTVIENEIVKPNDD